MARPVVLLAVVLIACGARGALGGAGRAPGPSRRGPPARLNAPAPRPPPAQWPPPRSWPSPRCPSPSCGSERPAAARGGAARTRLVIARRRTGGYPCPTPQPTRSNKASEVTSQERETRKNMANILCRVPQEVRAAPLCPARARQQPPSAPRRRPLALAPARTQPPCHPRPPGHCVARRGRPEGRDQRAGLKDDGRLLLQGRRRCATLRARWGRGVLCLFANDGRLLLQGLRR